MDIDAFKNALRTGIVAFEYEKKNGDTRKAVGTLKPDILKAVIGESKHEDKPKRKHSTSVISYYDCEKKAFRSFVAANLVAYKTM